MRKLLIAACALFTITCCQKPSDKPRIVWIEVGANFMQYGSSRENIATDCRRIADMGFTHVVVEVRPTSGNVLFKSDVAPKLTEVALWREGGLKYVPRTADFDYLQAWIDAGHAAGLKVLAGVNMMVGGFRCEAGNIGMLYDHPELRDWAAVDYSARGLVNHLDDDTTVGGRFMDPVNPEVQAFLLKLLEEVAAYDGLDGIVMDRCRFDDYALSEYIGHQPERWPVFEEPGHVFLDKEPDALEVSWLTFRCKVIHDFVERAVDTVHQAGVPLGIYVGAWFSEYYRSGVNWISPGYDLAKEEPTYSWATQEYKATGFADLPDFMLLGTYCPAANVHGSKEKTMQGYASLGRKRLCGDVPFAAGPDIGNEKGFETGDKGALIPEIATVIEKEADGFFLFDLCHIRMFDYWDDIRLK